MSKPNVLLVVLDSARADRLSCYGHTKQTSPQIDRIAEEGTLFERCQSESSWTVPTSVSLLTGLAPREHQAEKHRQLPDDMPCLQEALSGRGYTTLLAGANGFIGPVTGLDRGFDSVSNPRQVSKLTKPFTKFLTRRMGWTDNWGGTITARMLGDLHDVNGPWFATIWYNECHHPYMGKQPFSTKFSGRPLSALRRWRLMSRMRHMKELAATADEREWEDVRALYDGTIGYNDHLVGELRSGLEAIRAWEDTLVIVTADHGDLLGEHGLGGHRWAVGLYRPVTHVPMIVRFPGGEAAGKRADALVQLADVPRTVASICGCEDALAPTEAGAVDLRDAAEGHGREFAVSERVPIDERRLRREKRKNRSFDYGPHMGALALINDGEWEYTRWETSGDELFRASDSDQEHNLIDEHPGEAERLRAALDAWQERVSPHQSTSDVELEEDAQTRKRLEGLGYY
ncbi:MAG: sulfatase-like hydrolase/transferase [Armatimonadia bacterium]|nr:sulfatase-like hydrolase/transferase [Armatimonadia bacterium]